MLGGTFFKTWILVSFHTGYDCNFQEVSIKYCSIADQVLIGAHHHHLDKISTSPIFYDKSVLGASWSTDNRPRITRTKIHHDVWIGVRSTILSGVTVHTGAIIGAGAVVTKDIGPYEIWAGVPARKIGVRFEAELVQLLLESEWWDLSPAVLEKAAQGGVEPRTFLELIKHGYRQ